MATGTKRSEAISISATRRDFRYSVLTAVAVILLVSSSAKVHLLLTDPFADLTTGFSFPILWLAFFLEGVLCLASLAVINLAMGRATDTQSTYRGIDFAALIWLGQLITFFAFFILSLIRFLTGETSCGCFGKISLPIWASILLSGATIAALMIVQPNGTAILDSLNSLSKKMSRSMKGYLLAIVVSIVFLVLRELTPLRQLTFGIGNKPVPNQIVEMGDVIQQQGKRVEVNLKNESAIHAKIIGGGRSCTCLTDDTSFDMLRAGEEATVSVFIKPPSLGKFRQRLVYYLDHPQQNQIVLEFHGVVVVAKKK